MATRKRRRKNPEPESFGAVLPYDQWVDVEKVRVHEDGTMDVIVLDRQLAEAQLESANPRRRKKATANRAKRQANASGRWSYAGCVIRKTKEGWYDVYWHSNLIGSERTLEGAKDIARRKQSANPKRKPAAKKNKRRRTRR